MRRIARLERSIDLVKVRTSSHSTSSYLCSACRHRAAPFSTSTIRSAKVSYTEKIRKKLWGTDKPPGQADPYGNESVFNQTKKREEEERLEEEEERRKGSTAPVVDSSSYEQATTWGDNEQGRVPWVGGFGGWWAKNWDPENQFSGFLPQSKNIMKDPNQIRAALHRALVEVYASKQAGLPLDIPRATTWVPSQRIQIRPTETGVELDFSQATSQEAFMKSLEKIDETAVHEVPTESEEDVAADRSTVDPLHPDSTPAPVEETSVHENPTESEEDIVADRSASRGKVYKNERRGYKYENFARSSYPIWSQVPLTDPEIKFAVYKRVLQLTGIRIPDSAIHLSKTAAAFLSQLIEPPKPRKLAEAVKAKKPLVNLPNVKFSPTRVTPIDKEKSVGRWKLIEQELRERGLPVTGHST